MPDIRLTCTHCHATIKSATPVPAGKKVRCPKCQEFFIVPGDEATDGIQEQPTRKAGKSSSEFALDDDDNMVIRKKEPKKSNLVLILGLVGCAGLLLLTCVIGVPLLFLLLKAGPGQPAKMAAVAMAPQVAEVKFNDAGNKAAEVVPPGAGKLKKDYDEVRLGDHVNLIEKRMGGRGAIGAEGIPRLTDAKLGVDIAKNMNAFKVNVIWSWKDDAAGETLVIGFQEDVVGFKGFYTRVGPETRVVHQFAIKK